MRQRPAGEADEPTAERTGDCVRYSSGPGSVKTTAKHPRTTLPRALKTQQKLTAQRDKKEKAREHGKRKGRREELEERSGCEYRQRGRLCSLVKHWARILGTVFWEARRGHSKGLTGRGKEKKGGEKENNEEKRERLQQTFPAASDLRSRSQLTNLSLSGSLVYI